MKVMCPSADEAMARWWGERCRAAASPGAIRALDGDELADRRPGACSAAIRVPTLVVHRGTDFDVDVEEGRYIAERIPGARFVELPGADHFVGDRSRPDPRRRGAVPAEYVAAPVDRTASSRRVLVTTSSARRKGRRLGDAPGRPRHRHHEMVRGELADSAAEEIDTAGDGILALFDGPARAVRCARAIARRLAELGLAVRVGVHTGEVELAGTGARHRRRHRRRVAAAARRARCSCRRPSHDIVAGSGLEFADRGSGRSPASPANGGLLAVADVAQDLAPWRS